MTRTQLAPGTAVVTVPGQGLAVRTPDGEFLRVNTGQVAPEALVARLAGGETAPDAERDALVGAFAAAGYLAPPRAPWPAARRTVLLTGARTLTEPLAALLAAAGAEPRTGTADEAATAVRGHAAAVVWCLDEAVPHGLWDEADRLPERGVAWLRCHREGLQAWIEPTAARPGDVTSAQVRMRRLAATSAHRELAAYWNGHRLESGAPTSTAASAALIAALLATDLAAWAHGTPDNRRLRRIDLRDLTVTAHTVLPVPDVAPLPRPAE
ncbi:hypothetical protein NLX86_21825 [Streptomyces sp. A3M-1-3]|uniref:hypothetical protein n=1 Tax=Streptomyces sp. A3M-1-3 TaxID=2962044 RepID=UPI0020B85746|nr:hypothetical protein [Streptomyces sp. A3M-1-3]MCP3820637.1 hypothetical protein [Streptomyces sp. A3M-1-3]